MYVCAYILYSRYIQTSYKHIENVSKVSLELPTEFLAKATV